jgi:hypothetical protein
MRYIAHTLLESGHYLDPYIVDPSHVDLLHILLLLVSQSLQLLPSAV